MSQDRHNPAHGEPSSTPSLRVSLTALKSGIRTSGEAELEVLLRVQAPAVPGRRVQRRDRMRFGKEAMYSAHRMSRRISETDESAMFDAAMEQEKPAYLRKKSVQGRGCV